jgi:hypothetical protein
MSEGFLFFSLLLLGQLWLPLWLFYVFSAEPLVDDCLDWRHGELAIVLCLCVNELQLSSWRTSRGARTWERKKRREESPFERASYSQSNARTLSLGRSKPSGII